MSGDTAIVGVDTRDSEVGVNSGVVYVFERNHGGPNRWGEAARLRSSDLGLGDNLGRSVGIAGGRIAASAIFADVEGEENIGAVYVFERTASTVGWRQIEKLYASDFAHADSYGAAVAIGAGTVAVGAPTDDDAGFSSGALYVYEQQPLLRVRGECPGTIELVVTDATASGPVMLLGGAGEGSGAVTAGPCAGTVLHLTRPAVLDTLTAGDGGRVSASRLVASPFCDHRLQALDLRTCRVSNPVTVPEARA